MIKLLSLAGKCMWTIKSFYWEEPVKTSRLFPKDYIARRVLLSPYPWSLLYVAAISILYIYSDFVN